MQQQQQQLNRTGSFRQQPAKFLKNLAITSLPSSLIRVFQMHLNVTSFSCKITLQRNRKPLIFKDLSSRLIVVAVIVCRQAWEATPDIDATSPTTSVNGALLCQPCYRTDAVQPAYWGLFSSSLAFNSRG